MHSFVMGCEELFIC